MDNSERAKPKRKKSAVPPQLARVGPLSSFGEILKELGRLYRLGATGELEPEVMTKFAMLLREMRCTIESEKNFGPLADLQRRLAEVEAARGHSSGN